MYTTGIFEVACGNTAYTRITIQSREIVMTIDHPLATGINRPSPVVWWFRASCRGPHKLHLSSVLIYTALPARLSSFNSARSRPGTTACPLPSNKLSSRSYRL